MWIKPFIRLSHNQMHFFLPKACYNVLLCLKKDLHLVFLFQGSAEILA